MAWSFRELRKMPPRELFFLSCHLLADRLVVIDCRALAEVLELEELAQLDLAVLVVWVGAGHHPFDGLCLRLDLDDPVAGDQFLGFGKRPVDHAALAAGKADARALLARLKSAPG